MNEEVDINLLQEWGEIIRKCVCPPTPSLDLDCCPRLNQSTMNNQWGITFRRLPKKKHPISVRPTAPRVIKKEKKKRRKTTESTKTNANERAKFLKNSVKHNVLGEGTGQTERRDRIFAVVDAAVHLLTGLHWRRSSQNELFDRRCRHGRLGLSGRLEST